ncbi:hypothetical protein DSLASN_36180 [Desulfoluna limicola]|uniref:Uncharacterized protein n=1 Tax=Desulfoluna limicola TaxID=2810562 RepID=A0ABN6F8H5_9BACT|nr:hypothetical protein DSLASN_36180 [Desulfoluna limicola]
MAAEPKGLALFDVALKAIQGVGVKVFHGLMASGGQGMIPWTPGFRMLWSSFLAPSHSLTGCARD